MHGLHSSQPAQLSGEDCLGLDMQGACTAPVSASHICFCIGMHLDVMWPPVMSGVAWNPWADRSVRAPYAALTASSQDLSLRKGCRRSRSCLQVLSTAAQYRSEEALAADGLMLGTCSPCRCLTCWLVQPGWAEGAVWQSAVLQDL